MKSLVIGMGIGQLYKSVLEAAGHEVTTVDLDPARGADFTDVGTAIVGRYFDTVHICTPNWTHEPIARQVADVARIVFIEKPGLQRAYNWQCLVEDFPKTRFMMVKNNQYRSNIEELKAQAKESPVVSLKWINKNRVPNAGSWFTDSDRSWGGVSRDLIPHLLSLVAVFEPNFADLKVVYSSAFQRWIVADLTDTEYGTVNQDGIYDVDDFAAMTFQNANRTYQLTADWRSNTTDDRGIDFWPAADGTTFYRFELGLCPEDAYARMIDTAFRNVYNDSYWDQQLAQDLWIHQQMELLCPAA